MAETVNKNLDLTQYPFPNLTKAEIAFSTVETDRVLLKEAELRGMDDHYHPYVKLFSTLFYKGGKVKFKEGIDPEFRDQAWTYMRALMSSFAPKHEHKEAVCALILSELVEPELQKD